MIYIVGVDGGGTKTIGLLADQGGLVLATAESGPSNYRVVGEARTKEVLANVISQLLTQINATLTDCSFGLGIAGLGAAPPIRRYL